MGWSPAEISLVAVELLAALALVVLWFADRTRSYTLWWALSHAVLPLPYLLITFAHAQDHPSLPVILTLCLGNAVQAVCMMAGVISYRATRVRLRPVYVLVAVVLLASGFFVLMQQEQGQIVTRIAMLSAMAVALLSSAVMMWSLGLFERFAAVCFGLRGALELGLIALIFLGDSRSNWITHYLGFNALIAITTMLAILVAAYQRSLRQQRAHYRFLELSQQVSGQLQGVSDESDLAHRVLSIIVERLDWESGVFLRQPDPDEFTLVAVSNYGADSPNQIPVGVVFTPPEGGMIAAAMTSRRVAYSVNLNDDSRVTLNFDRHPELVKDTCLVVAPVVHDGIVHGVIVLRDTRRRELPEAEIRTLESLGQVIGISAANARNLWQLTHRANHDALTDLGNRSALHDYLGENSISRFAVLLFDLDHFKHVNDALGHAVGDQLLRAIALRLRHFLGDESSQLFRLGGDEFVIIHAMSAEVGKDSALDLAEELAQVIEQPTQIGELSLRLSASIGVAVAPDHSPDSHELLRCADVAMYHAKHTGSVFALYRREIDAYKLEDLTLLSAVTEGLEKQQFSLFYQPILNAATGKTERCEALIRWHHPVRGLIEASAFMPLIETTGLIRPVTHRVIDIAMADMASWQKQGLNYQLAINLSARNILDPELPDYLLSAAAKHGVTPGKIQLEITETMLIKDPKSSGRILQQLTAAGFTLALDDFGTGYSSMSYLARFPIHMLKIDRSFVHAMLGHAQSRAIVETTISLARGLGLKVTAEGVEQEEEVQVLNELGCDYLQGFLFSRPVPEHELMATWQRDYGYVEQG